MTDEPISQVKSSLSIASSKDRLLAYLIDLAILTGVFLLAWPVILTHAPFTLMDILPVFILTFLFYEVLFEITLKGQTPGKGIRGLKLVRLDGTPPGFSNYFRRWLLRPLGILPILLLLLVVFLGGELTTFVVLLPVGLILLLTMLKIGKTRHWGDKISGAAVIKNEPQEEVPVTEVPAEDRPEAPGALIDNIEKASLNARRIYLLFIGLLAYCALTVAGTSDRRIILNEPANLPVINLEVSLDGFFILAPLLAIFIFVYFQLYLHKLKRLLDKLRSKYQPLAEDEKIYPWMLNFVSELGSGFVARTQRFIVNFSLWWSLPAVLMILALWYLKKHDPLLCSIVGMMPLLGTVLVAAFWTYYQHSSGFAFQFKFGQLKQFLKTHKDKGTLLALVLLFEIYLFAVFMPRALRGENIFGTWPGVDLSYQNLTGNREEVYWVNLRDADLQGADFSGAILERADLRQANLEGAKLEEANLRKADLSGANLRGAKLTGAIIDSALFNDLIGNLNKLRSNPDTSLSDEAVDLMLAEKGFFDTEKNSSGKGYPNRFEIQKEDSSVVVDLFSGLTWQRSGSPNYMSHSEAKLDIDSLNSMNNGKGFAGFSDWRLPTLEEAMSLMEAKQNEDNGLYINSLFDERQPWIWTSDRYSASAAWLVNFIFGGCYHDDVGIYGNHVRAVRSGH
jgi:uncharacterized RDD family membrane protein YckC